MRICVKRESKKKYEIKINSLEKTTDDDTTTCFVISFCCDSVIGTSKHIIIISCVFALSNTRARNQTEKCHANERKIKKIKAYPIEREPNIHNIRNDSRVYLGQRTNTMRPSRLACVVSLWARKYTGLCVHILRTHTLTHTYRRSKNKKKEKKNLSEFSCDSTRWQIERVAFAFSSE